MRVENRGCGQDGEVSIQDASQEHVDLVLKADENSEDDCPLATLCWEFTRKETHIFPPKKGGKYENQALPESHS